MVCCRDAHMIVVEHEERHGSFRAKVVVNFCEQCARRQTTVSDWPARSGADGRDAPS
jgi:predicted site-specific integrase-resolvase